MSRSLSTEEREDALDFVNCQLQRPDLAIETRIGLERKRDALKAADPTFAERLAEIDQALSRPLSAEERAHLEGEREHLLKLADHYQRVDSQQARDRQRWTSVFCSDESGRLEGFEEAIASEAAGRPRPATRPLITEQTKPARVFDLCEKEALFSDFLMMGGAENGAGKHFDADELAAIAEISERVELSALDRRAKKQERRIRNLGRGPDVTLDEGYVAADKKFVGVARWHTPDLLVFDEHADQ
jgi:hypothetical protein